jgi:Tfp pilus assembly protein PilX
MRAPPPIPVSPAVTAPRMGTPTQKDVPAMCNRKRRNESGASLIIVLIVISVFGLILTGLLTEAGASVKYTTIVNGHEQKVYAADAGVSLGIQRLQQGNQLCPVTGPEAQLDVTTVNGLSTRITCEVTSGSTMGGLGYAIITRSPASNSLDIQSGQAKNVTGPIFVTGDVSGWNKGINLASGDMSQLQGNGCTSTKPTNLTLDAGHGYFCGTAVPSDPPHAAPASVPAAPRAATTSGACKIFYPGLYTAAPSLGSGTNYFASGIYYFKFSGQFAVDQVMYGGAPASWEGVQYAPMPSCATDATAIAKAGGAAPEVIGTGVQFIFGAGASLFADNGSKLEVFNRTADGTSKTLSPSIVAVPPDWAAANPAWVENTHDTSVLDFHNGSNPDEVIHGLVYAPYENVRVYSTNGVDAAILGGIVAWRLELQSSASGNGLAVMAGDGLPDPRHIVVRATAPYPAVGGEKSVTSTAVVQIANDANRTVTVDSWRTQGASDPV